MEDRRPEYILGVLRELGEVNESVPIVVEGKRDREALRKIGLEGEILLLHGGKSIYEFCEDLLEFYGRIVLLLDWDSRGESLYRQTASLLRGHYEEFSFFRKRLKGLSQSEIKEVEELPALLKRLTGSRDFLFEE